MFDEAGSAPQHAANCPVMMAFTWSPTSVLLRGNAALPDRKMLCCHQEVQSVYTGGKA